MTHPWIAATGARRCSLLLGLFFLSATLGCNPRTRVASAARTAREALPQGDQAYCEGRLDEGKNLYDRAAKALARVKPLLPKVDESARTSMESLEKTALSRQLLFGTPEDFVRGILSLAGSGEQEDLLKSMFDTQDLAQKALGRETWASLSPEDQERFSVLVKNQIARLFGMNRAFYSRLEIHLPESREDRDRIILKGTGSFGQDKISLQVILRKTGPTWKALDVLTDVFGVSFSELFAGSFAHLESLGSLQEFLGRENAAERLADSFLFTMQDTSTVSERDQRVVFVKGDTVMKQEDGTERTLGKGSMVQVLGPKETVEGKVLLKIRTFAKHKTLEGEQIRPDTTLGWVPEGALFEIGEESIWGTE